MTTQPRTTTNAPPPFPITTDTEARAMLHGAGATFGDKHLWVTVPTTTPIYDLIRAGQRLGYEVTSESRRTAAGYWLVMGRAAK